MDIALPENSLSLMLGESIKRLPINMIRRKSSQRITIKEAC
jgi:hypothetical protein